MSRPRNRSKQNNQSVAFHLYLPTEYMKHPKLHEQEPMRPDILIEPQDPWAAFRRPTESDQEGRNMPKQLELPFTNEDEGDSVG